MKIATRSVAVLLASAAAFWPAVDVAPPHAQAAATSSSASATATGLRVQVIKPAALPTSDEVATLSLPFAHAESDALPSTRAIGSWLWAGEAVADAKSLLLVGTDPSADEAACVERRSGASHPRRLATIPNPAGGQITVEDPTDNPCGSASVKQILAGTIDDNPQSATYGSRGGGVVRALPDYPFWAHSQYPSANAETNAETTICQAPGAVPTDPWRTPKDACPPGGPPPVGVARASALREHSDAFATMQAIGLSIVKTGSLSSSASTRRRGGIVVADARVDLQDLMIEPGAGVLIKAETVTAHATATSDGRSTTGSFEVSGVTLSLAFLPDAMPCSAIKPCAARLGSDGAFVPLIALPDPVAGVVKDVLSTVRVEVPPTAQDLGPANAALGGGVEGPGVTVAKDQRSVEVAGITIQVAFASSGEGASAIRFTIGSASASAATTTSQTQERQGEATSRPADDTTTAAVGASQPIFSSDRKADRAPNAQAVIRSGVGLADPGSRGIPAALTAVVLVLTLGLAAALVAFGVWQTDP